MSDGEGMCVSSLRGLCCIRVCASTYVNELVALPQFLGSQGVAYSEQYCMFTVLTHIHSGTYIHTHADISVHVHLVRPLGVETCSL